MPNHFLPSHFFSSPHLGPYGPHQCPPWPTFNWHVQVHLAAAALNPPSNPSPLSTPSSFAIALYQSYVQTWNYFLQYCKNAIEKVVHQMAPRHIYHSSSIYSTTTKQSQIKDDTRIKNQKSRTLSTRIASHRPIPEGKVSLCVLWPLPLLPLPLPLFSLLKMLTLRLKCKLLLQLYAGIPPL